MLHCINGWPISEKSVTTCNSWQPQETGVGRVSSPNLTSFLLDEVSSDDFSHFLARNPIDGQHDHLYQPFSRAAVDNTYEQGQNSMTQEDEPRAVRSSWYR